MIFLQIIRCPTFSIGGLLLQQVVQNCCELMGRGRRGFGWPQFAPHAAKKRPKIAGARAETLRGHAQGATGTILDPSTARGQHFAATDLILGTEPQPGRKMFVPRPLTPSAAHFGEDRVDRQGWSARHVGELHAGDPGQMGAEIKGRFGSLRLPMGGCRWG